MLDVRDGTNGQAEGPINRGWYSFAPRFRGEGTEARRAWRTTYVHRTLVADGLCAAMAALAGYLVRFGHPEAAPAPASLWVILLPLVWVAVMLVARTYE